MESVGVEKSSILALRPFLKPLLTLTTWCFIDVLKIRNGGRVHYSCLEKFCPFARLMLYAPLIQAGIVNNALDST
jgi:hypothetical protein